MAEGPIPKSAISAEQLQAKKETLILDREANEAWQTMILKWIVAIVGIAVIIFMAWILCKTTTELYSIINKLSMNCDFKDSCNNFRDSWFSFVVITAPIASITAITGMFFFGVFKNPKDPKDLEKNIISSMTNLFKMNSGG